MGAKRGLAAARSLGGVSSLADSREAVETRLRAIIDATPECVKLVDPVGRLLEMNQAGLRMIDCEHFEDVVGHNLAELIAPADRQVWVQNHKRVCAGESLRWEFLAVTMKGRAIHLETNAVPVAGPDGRICQLAVTRDITEQRARMSALAASERTLSQAIKATGLGISVHDHLSGKITVNAEMREIVRYPEGVEPSLENYIELIPPKDRERCRAAVLSSYDPAGDGVLRIDHAIVTPEGERRSLEVWAQTTFTDAGKHRVPECTIAAVRDVTEAHRAFEDVREAEARWRNLFNSMQEGYIVGEVIEPTNGGLVDFRIVDSNDQWEVMTGIPIEDVLGRSFRAAVPGVEEFWYDLFHRVVRTGESVTCEHYVEPMQRWFDVRAYRHSPGNFSAVYQNVTDRKLAEAAREVAQHEQFRVSRLSAMGAMASTLAHELNQPLATSANYLNALLAQLDGRRIDAGALRHSATEALAACLRAGDIIRRIRSFTMEGQVVRHRERLSSIVEAAADDLRRQPIAAGVTIRVEPPAAELFVECDRVQIEQVLGNLLRNSAQAMENSPRKRIDLRLEQRGFHAIMIVEDSGPGLDPELVKHLFDPFSTSKKDGLGLGLALCRTIIDAHKGTINGASGTQGGAVFEVTLPAAA